MNPIYAIRTDESFASYLDAEGAPLRELSHLGRVNLFVGSNSSGKSRFLRRLACMSDYFVKFDESSLQRVGRDLGEIFTAIMGIYRGHDDDRSGVRRKQLQELVEDTPAYVRLGEDPFRAEKETLASLGRSQRMDIQKAAKRGLDLLEAQGPKKTQAHERQYIPVLRGLRVLRQGRFDANGSEKTFDYYRTRTEEDYFEDDKKNRIPNAPDVFTGLMLFSEIRQMLLGFRAERSRISDFQRFLGQEFFEGKEVVLLPHIDSDVLYVKIGDEQEHPIYALGDGVQQAIVLAFRPFAATKPTFFFIEEPELHMHPGLQRKLLDFFIQHPRCRQHHFFITTHSNHLLDMTADYTQVAVINLRKRLKQDATHDGEREPEFLVQPMDAGDESILLDLGVRNSSVFLVNATIWVEGITDRLYLRAFLDLYQTRQKTKDNAFLRVQEDVHFAIVEYGGSNVTHFFLPDDKSPSITLKRVCGKVFLLIDEDGLGKQDRKQKLEKAVGGYFAMTPGREIENLLPLAVIHSVVRDFEEANGGTIPDLTTKPKPHRHAPLGKYIHEHLLTGAAARPGGYWKGSKVNQEVKTKTKKESGTIKDKVTFCHKAIEKLTSFDELGPEVQGLVKRIYEFILARNK